jgi:Domain of unknown function (DUF4062)
MSIPTVMVSSTFYDLAQVRTDLREFLEDEVGYRSLLSEHPSFPIDPDADTIENCRRRVEQDADILVLVIGGRYGYVDEASDKSVTNLEYLEARAKGIPIYAFVDRTVTAVLPVWKSNRDADFSGRVDSVRLFEFVEQVRSEHWVWAQEFGRAQDIVAALRIQFAHLTADGLRWRRRLQGRPQRELRDLHGEALRLALEQPKAWEYRLFGQVLSDEVEASEDLLRQHQLGILLGPGERAPSEGMGHWIGTQIAELERIVAAADILINQSLQEAFRPPGTPGDIAEIVFVARQLGAAHRHAVEWSQRLRRAHVPERFESLINEMAKFSDNVIEQLGNFGPNVLRQLEEGLANLPGPGEEPRVVTVSLVFQLSNFDSYQQEFRRLMQEDG